MRITERFAPFIERKGRLKVIYVATCDARGQPNCAPRLIVDIVEPNIIFYVDFKASQSRVNISQTNMASLAFMDESSLMSFKVDGVCEILAPGKELSRVKAKWTKITNIYHAERIIERIKGIISGRAKEILPDDDYVFVKFIAKKMKELISPPPSAYPIEQIAALQLHIDELEKDAEETHEREKKMEVSRNFYKARSTFYETAAMEDSLTQLYNKRGFTMLVEQQLKISKREKKETFFVSLDVDSLKQINDTFGHEEGDKALVDVAAILKKSFRESDIIARMGGDEFVVAMVNCEKDNLDSAEGRLKKNIEELNRNTQAPYVIELSIGIASCKPDETVNLDNLLGESDHRMYEDKKTKKKR